MSSNKLKKARMLVKEIRFKHDVSEPEYEQCMNNLLLPLIENAVESDIKDLNAVMWAIPQGYHRSLIRKCVKDLKLKIAGDERDRLNELVKDWGVNHKRVKAKIINPDGNHDGEFEGGLKIAGVENVWRLVFCAKNHGKVYKYAQSESCAKELAVSLSKEICEW